uniref:F-box protein AT5G49610-like beta-propeller domain-containing protein n=1 Tax=Aegilops tauschii TaxID=37682 RepID=M8BKY1_AEGTA
MPMCFTFYSSVLVGKSLLYFMSDDAFILECDLARHRLAVFNPPNHEPVCGQYTIMLAEDGGLGVCQRMDQQLKVWSREVSDSVEARWVLSRVVYLENLLPVGALVDAETRVQVLGFAEGANTIFLTTVDGIFMIKLQSERARRVCDESDDHLFCDLIPVVSFYTPVPRGEHRDPSLKHSEDAGGEEKTVYQVQQLINKMSQMLPGGDFVNAFDCINHAIENSVLVGRSLLYFMSDDGCILEYDFAGHDLTVFDPPNYESIYDGRYNIMLAEDGGLGVSQEMNPHLKLWTRVIEGADARWVLSRVIYLQNLLPDGALVEPASSLYVLGFAEGANAIFMTTVAGLFTIELQSERVRRVCDDHALCNLIPIVSFYTPVPRGEQKDPSFEPSEDAGDQEGGVEEKKTVGQAHQLFDNGSNIIKEGGFVGAFDYISHDLENRVPPNGEVVSESTDMGVALYEAREGSTIRRSCSGVYQQLLQAGCDMKLKRIPPNREVSPESTDICVALYEAREVTDPLGDVPKTA